MALPLIFFYAPSHLCGTDLSMLGIHGSVCNFVPGLHAGRLLDLETMKKPCTCGQWIRREPLVGYQKTAAAAQYPKQLCEAYCKLLITAFKHTLQLEYWRSMLKTKEQEVSTLKRKWIESKERIYRGPPEGRPTADPSKRVWESTQIAQDVRPLMGMSKKARREEENERYIGGVRGERWRSCRC